MSYDIVPTKLAVKAMRDNGYKNAAYAIAELIDNAIQAGADKVELLCAEEEVQLNQRRRSRIHALGVLDNGCGMDADTLRIALQFGNGTHLDDDQDGIGRFGMGLPSSSISQCRRVEVWTWQNSPENAIYSYLDLDEIGDEKMCEVPSPITKPIPDIFRKTGKVFGETGTLIVWTDLDRIMWKTANAIIDNSEFLIGRMYRYFIHENRVSIRMAAFDRKKPVENLSEKYARPNDPIYLLENTSCPAPFDNQPMFEPWGEPTTFYIHYGDNQYPVTVKFSYAKEEARQGYNPGSEPYGQHAKRNVGVSIVRANRELDLDPSWSNPSDTRDRWWGVEVDFAPGLDELFGVTNNKQSARHFSEMAKVDIEELVRDEGITLSGKFEELHVDEDPRLPLLEIASHVQKNINSIRRSIKTQTAGTKRSRYDDGKNDPEAIATQATDKRKEDGLKGESDTQEELPAEQRQSDIEDTLVEEGLTKQAASQIAAVTVGRSLKYTFAEANINTPAFFDVKARGGSLIVSLNTNHPAYSRLVEVLEREFDESDIDELRTRIATARDGLKLLLMAWARYEDEMPDGPRRRGATEARWDWGRIASQFLDDNDFEG
ncbi:MAG: ATP-binding protein [Anaerolineales bacterium]|nr:ATP-binding protein [Anaerolineales bacterium]